jgi:peptidoglycan biosynthesis protein MviN/MurJ (putative lipid II flippase)
MSTQTALLGADARRPPAPLTPSDAPFVAAGEGAARRKARAGLAMSLATFAMAAASAIQAVLYLGHFGTNVRTDGFFVAFALYSTFGVFSQSLRLTSVPLLVEPGARLSVRAFAATLACVALPILLLTIPLAGPLAHLIAPGLAPSGRAATRSALPVLGCAMVLQLWAAGGATVLAIRDRFTLVAGAYMSGALAGLVAFLALMSSAGVETLGWSMLAMALVTCAWMMAGLARSGGLAGGRAQSSLAPAALARNAGIILGRTGVYLAFNVLFVITLAFASHAAAGGTTVLSYAYLFASYLVAGTGMALGMSSIPDMTRDARTRGLELVAETVPRGYRYAMLIVAPALAALIAVGAPLVHALLTSSLSAAEVATLRTFGALLVPWTVCALLVNFMLPVLFALGRAGLLNALALPLVLVHLTATAIGSALFGVDGAVGAFWVAPACFAFVLLRAGAGRERTPALLAELAGDAARFLALAALSFGAGWALGVTLPSELAQVALAAVVGGGLYVAGLRLFARRQLQVLLNAVVVRPAAA